ncbi:hypothetical protein ACLIA0_00885 [Bacillaceae bacterium W0354]
MSAFITTAFTHIEFNIKQEAYLKEQTIIQDLIQLSINDFFSMKDEIEITTKQNDLTFTYLTGRTNVSYYLKDENRIHLTINVLLKNGKSFRTIIDV